jgi:hypothetical protein
MKKEAKGTLYTCDACGDETFVADGDMLPMGLHVNVFHVSAGGDGFEFFSCKTDTEHFAQAFDVAWTRYLNMDNEQ